MLQSNLAPLTMQRVAIRYQSNVHPSSGSCLPQARVCHIDDFGTGYSSLSYLQRFPINRLKIDQSFVRDLGGNVDSGAISSAIITLGHSLGLKVIAEGVETIEQPDFLDSIQCNEIQGYYFSKPLPAEQMRKFLEQSQLPIA